MDRLIHCQGHGRSCDQDLEILYGVNWVTKRPQKGRLSFLIGLPRSGKSTFANEAMFGNVIVGGDDIRKAMTGQRYNGHCELFIDAMKVVFVKSLLDRGFDVLVDDTHTTWNSIRPLLQIDPNAQVIFWPHLSMFARDHYKFDVSTQEFWNHVNDCRARAIETNQPDLDASIYRMGQNLKILIPTFQSQLAQYRDEYRHLTHRIV